MKRKSIRILATILTSVLVLFIAISCIARFVFLSPCCYSDNTELSENENYFIKKIILETVEDRLSALSGNGKHLFVWINTDFMDSAKKENGEYIINVQTHFMETVSDDCRYEILCRMIFQLLFSDLIHKLHTNVSKLRNISFHTETQLKMFPDCPYQRGTSLKPQAYPLLIG